MTAHLNDVLSVIPDDFDFAQHWLMMGIFPTQVELDRDDGPRPWNWFNYTSGLGDPELWAPAVSIEGQRAGNDVVGVVLNYLAFGLRYGIYHQGVDVIVPIGVAVDGEREGEDMDSVWWIGNARPARELQVNITESHWAVPVLWSSPLGWKDET